MTKAELIRKIAKHSGAPDSEAKLFFEILLRKIASLTEQGDALLINDFGYFISKKGKMRTSNFENEEIEVYLDLIVFNLSNENKNENLIFSVPDLNQNVHEHVDSYFSLSIGKPVIPLQGVKDIDFFLPPSGNELRRLVESKVEKLIDESEVIKNYSSGNDFILINNNLNDKSQMELEMNNSDADGNDVELQNSKIDAEDSINYDELNWNYSSDLSKQIEEESLLDTGKDYDTIFEEEASGLSWDFGNVADENYSYSMEETNEFSEESNAENLNGLNELPNETSNQIIEDKNEFDENEKNDEALIRDDLLEEELTQNGNTPLNISEEKLDEEPVPHQHKITIDEKIVNERKSYTWLFIIIAIIIFAAAYYFINSMGNDNDKSNINSGKNNSSNKVINQQNDRQPLAEPIADKENDLSDSENSGEEINSSPVKIEKITDNIYKYGERFVVQVSSWQSKEKADHQVDLFSSTENKAFIEEAKLGGTIWYRVRVGYFSALDDAKKYLNKN